MSGVLAAIITVVAVTTIGLVGVAIRARRRSEPVATVTFAGENSLRAPRASEAEPRPTSDPLDPGVSATIEEAAVRSREMLAAAEKERESLYAEALLVSERMALAIRDEVNRQAETLIKNAEEQARMTLAAANRERERLDLDIAREHALLDKKRVQLSELLSGALGEVRQAAGR